MIAYWPGKIQEGVSHHSAAAWDLLPTIGEIAGVTVPDHIDGISFLPELLGKKQAEHEVLYWEYYAYNWNWGKPGNTSPRNRLESKAVRFGTWKAIRYDTLDNKQAAIALYNLVTDPVEAYNVAAKHPEIVKKVADYMESCSTGNAPYFPYVP